MITIALLPAVPIVIAVDVAFPACKDVVFSAPVPAVDSCMIIEVLVAMNRFALRAVAISAASVPAYAASVRMAAINAMIVAIVEAMIKTVVVVSPA